MVEVAVQQSIIIEELADRGNVPGAVKNGHLGADKALDAGTVKGYAINSSSSEIATINGSIVIINSLIHKKKAIHLAPPSDSGEIKAVAFTANDENLIMLTESGNIFICQSDTGESIGVLEDIKGPIVHGCDLTKLHPDSYFSKVNKEVLHTYGAIV